MRLVKASVGIHNGIQCYNVMSPQQPDQQNVMELLNKIPEYQGGTLSATGPRQWPTLRWGICSPELHRAIVRFQETNRSRGLIVDGHVDPGGRSILLMNKLAGESGATAAMLKVSFFWAQPCQADATAQVAYARQQLAPYNLGLDTTSAQWSPAADLTFNANRGYPDDVSIENLIALAAQQSPHPGRLTVIVMNIQLRYFNAMTETRPSMRPFTLLNGLKFGTQLDDGTLIHELNNAAGGIDNEEPRAPTNIATTPATVPRTSLTPAQVDRLKRSFFA